MSRIRSLGLDNLINFICSRDPFPSLTLPVSFHSLLLVLCHVLDLVGQVVGHILLLLAHARDVSLGRKLLLLEIAADLLQLSLAFLVHVHLSLGGTTGLIQTLTKLFQFTVKFGALLLGLRAGNLWLKSLSIQLRKTIIDFYIPFYSAIAI